MINPLDNAGLFLVQAVFDIYIFIVMLRIVLQWVNADLRNPLFAFIAKLTTPPLKPFRRFIPSIHGIDLVAIIFLLLLELIKITLLIWLQASVIPAFGGLVILSFAEILNQFINIFFYAIIALAILSWLNPLAHSPLIDVLIRLTEPIMRPVRRVIPLIGGLDISPIPVLIALKLLSILIVQPLIGIGAALAIGLPTT
jgi:YggT family protein